ncbi:PD-(D/E)XK nuclease family protein [Geothermobacter hydrogeniphilus]|uniref:PD-(D/E)XK endonuclease-like domain-containing protein n=1 Tax=Geothermobacter hydrogeniphilus TaxID=1969733 RepID=A0A1X0XSJ7_9BACT|nr:PD-(D/E)XK nuclease family protein [Geothermobacter hydrogeniphilus]ORJ55893.1 hypothetical protein B5V00_14635 [Geothermobacter hydrogeniphilus]
MKRTTFLLCPDRTSARYLRRRVAERRPAAGVLVGTWPELLQQAQDTYLLSEPADSWSARLGEAAAGIDGAFWQPSLALAPSETLGILDRVLQQLLAALAPGQTLDAVRCPALSPRGERYLADLVRLQDAVGHQLPPQLAVLEQLLSSDASRALGTVAVALIPGWPELNPRQQALVAKLNRDAGSAPDDAFQALLDETSRTPCFDDPPAGLAFLQRNLFTAVEQDCPPDPSVQFLAVRDYLQEAEVIAGMVQKALAEDDSLGLDQIGLLLPDDARYAPAVREVFALAGLPLAGLPESAEVRDLGREVMDGNFRLEKMEWPPEGKSFLAALVKGVASPPELLQLLEELDQSLAGREGPAVAVQQARELLAELQSGMAGQSVIPWDSLLALAAPSVSHDHGEEEVPLQGIAVFQESLEPWRAVRRLYVLGFNAGHYPQEESSSPVFSDTDQDQLKQLFAGRFETAADRANKRRRLFKRQLAFAAEEVCFFISRRDAFGKRMGPSTSLTFMAQLFGSAEPESLICELDSESGRNKVSGLALAAPATPVVPRCLQAEDLDLGCDLVALQTRDDGSLYPLSPSRLEILMVSPLAWLMGRAGLEPREWAPETLDVASRGTLAHAVFEWLFPVGSKLPAEETIRSRVPVLLRQAISTIKPFLLGAEWQVERNHLEQEVLVAALRWRSLLETLGARILGTEVWLEGRLDDLPLHGAADLLLSLPDGRLYVVDYKKSKSKKRKERMTAAYDSQASLYRLMLETGGVSSAKSPDAGEAVRQAKEVGVMYYLLNDQVVLADTDGWLDDALDEVEEMAGDISGEALKLIRQRLVEVRQGRVRLNRVDDEERFDKEAGIKLYALDNSPLLRLFMHPLPEEES